MSIASAPVKHQRMGGLSVVGGGPDPNDPATVGVFKSLDWAVEGETINFILRRVVGRRDTEVTVTYQFTSDAGDADFADSPVGSAVLPAGDLEVSISMDTVQRSGVQNDRAVRCALTAINNGFIDPLNGIASMELRDYSAPTGGWWITDGAWRSGRKWRGGASYWNKADIYAKYEAQVAYLDGLGAGNFNANSTNDYLLMTWDRVVGGPAGKPDTIMAKSQLDWSLSNDFPNCYKLWTPGHGYLTWVCDWIPYAGDTPGSGGRTDGTGDSRKKVWQEIINGNHDAKFKAMGNRIMINLAARSIDPKWFLMRPFHEMQQTNYYRVWADTKLLFRDALARMIDKIREGAGYNLRCFFAPSMDRTYKGENFGDIGTWCPDNVDGVSMSFHPNKGQKNRSDYLKLVNGTAALYGIEGDVAEYCRLKSKPMAFLEWSPRYNTSVIADDVYNWFYREFLWPRSDDVGIVVDLVYDQDTLNPEAATPYLPPPADDTQTPAGVQNWKDGVQVFKKLWKGKGPNWPNYVPPTTGAPPAEWYP